MKSGVLALILAGGRGTRMGPLCLHRAKPLLPMGIQHRLIDFPIENSLTSGLDHVAVLADYQRQSLVAYFDQRWAARVQPSRQFDILKPATGSYAGTADAVFQNLSYLEASGADTVLVLAADHVYAMDYRPMLQFHRQCQADVTIGVVPIPREEAQRFGAAAMDDESKVIADQEKPVFPLGNLGSMGIYVFSMDYLNRILCRDAADPASVHDFGHSILPRAVEEGANVFGYRFSGFWQDVGTVESFYRTSMLVLRSAPWPRPVALPENEPSTVPSHQELRGRIHNSLIASDSHILGDVYNSIIGPGCVVDEGAEVRNSVLFVDVYVGRNAELETTVIDDGAKVGELCRVGGRYLGPSELRPITVIGHMAQVPPRTLVVAGCHIYPIDLGAELRDRRSRLITPSQLNPVA